MLLILLSRLSLLIPFSSHIFCDRSQFVVLALLLGFLFFAITIIFVSFFLLPLGTIDSFIRLSVFVSVTKSRDATSNHTLFSKFFEFFMHFFLHVNYIAVVSTVFACSFGEK